jgi:hypothetical protein
MKLALFAVMLIAVAFAALKPVSTFSQEAKKTSQSSTDSDEAAIRAARSRLNEAFAKRRITDMSELMVENLSMTGPKWRSVSRDVYIRETIRLIESRPEITEIYEPQVIRINTGWWYAAESGEWRETWLEKGVLTELRGSYQALWRRVDGRWLLDAQVFIPLSCKGASYCDQRKG